MWLSDEQQRVWRNYLMMVGKLQVAMNRQLQDSCGLSLADYDVLVALDERCPIRMSELGDVLGWEQSRLSHQLRRMRERGLLTREGRDDDRRGANVDLTDDGRAALAAAAPGHAELVRSVVFDGMGAGELRALGSVTGRVLGRLGVIPG
jgi:DNA-binding MarR family transcriptional regulator